MGPNRYIFTQNISLTTAVVKWQWRRG